MKKASRISVSKQDLLAAWSVLENLTVSLDQIGGSFGQRDSTNGKDMRALAMTAVDGYLTPELVEAISDARSRLAPYIPEDEAEALTEKIPYWDYAGLKKPVLSK